MFSSADCLRISAEFSNFRFPFSFSFAARLVQMENHSAEGEKVANDGDQMETGSEQDEEAANDEGGVEEMELEDHDEEDERTANE